MRPNMESTMARNAQKIETPAESAATASVLKWHEYDVDLRTLPESSIIALAQRGFTHIMGNEVAAYESGLKAEKNENGEPKYTPSEVAVLAHDRRITKINEMLAGELGVRTAGARLPKLDRVIRDVAKEILITRATEKGLIGRLPKASDTKAWNTYVDRYLAAPANAATAKGIAEQRLALTAAPVATDALDEILEGL